MVEQSTLMCGYALTKLYKMFTLGFLGDEESFAGTDGSHHVVEDKRNDHEDWFIEKDCHDHLKKLLSTVKQSVVNEMRRRELTAQHVAKTNKTLPLSVYDCEFCLF